MHVTNLQLRQAMALHDQTTKLCRLICTLVVRTDSIITESQYFIGFNQD